MSLIQQAKNLGTAIVEHAAGGFKHVDEETLTKRLSICNECEFFDKGRCKKCGCHMGVKAQWAEQKCLIDKW